MPPIQLKQYEDLLKFQLLFIIIILLGYRISIFLCVPINFTIGTLICYYL